MIAVLDDLRTYADLNDLGALAASLATAAAVAEREIGTPAPAGGGARRDRGGPGQRAGPHRGIVLAR